MLKYELLVERSELMVKQIAIIGGGIVGATAAFYLSHLPGSEQIQVTLFDDGTGQATKAASGIISPWLSKRRNKRWYALAKAGAELYPKLVTEAQLGPDAYQQTGTIVTRKSAKDLEKLYQEALTKADHTPAMGHVTLLSSEAVQQRLPLLSNPPAGVFVSGGAKIDGANFVWNLLERAQQTNLKIIRQTVSLTADGDIITEDGLQQFDQTIIATGAWMKKTLTPMGITMKIRPQKGQLIDLKLSQQLAPQSMPVLMPEGSSDIIPFNNGKLVIGATHENEGGFDLKATQVAAQQLLNNARAFMAHLNSHQITGVRVGTRAYTDDFAPFFGRLPNRSNILVGGGLGSSGLTTGPIIGYLLAHSIFGQSTTDWQQYTKPVSQYIE